MEFHPVANIFPLMSGKDFEELTEDIRANGLHESIWLYEGKIIDGRNRYLACVAADITPTYRTWDGRGSLVSFVVSLNLHRRHLTVSQRAVVSLDVMPMLEAEAKERYNATVGRPSKLVEIFPPITAPGKAREHAAAMFDVNSRYIQDAKKLQSVAPDLVDRIRGGELSIGEAKREVIKRDRPSIDMHPTPNKYRVIYADPPWQYGNKTPDYVTKPNDHYPLMALSEICALPVKQMAEDNAVLFLWVTSPLLEECFEVIDAWGFKYKSSFVWDKIKHNMGHYNSVRHEFLLICVRGSCQPDINKLFDSVQSIERTEHSRKPEEFREIIDTIYPYGKRIELFARGEIKDNWEVWGNESIS